MTSRPLTCCITALAVAAFPAAGCGNPNPANIILRKQSQGLESQLVQLKRQHDADQATIAGLTNRSGGTVPMLPPDRLDRLFTVHGIKLTRLTGGADLDPAKPGDEGLKLYVDPYDQHGDAVQYARSLAA